MPGHVHITESVNMNMKGPCLYRNIVGVIVGTDPCACAQFHQLRGGVRRLRGRVVEGRGRSDRVIFYRPHKFDCLFEDEKKKKKVKDVLWWVGRDAVLGWAVMQCWGGP